MKKTLTAIAILLGVCSCCLAANNIKITKRHGLILYQPNFTRIDLVCNTMPSPNNKSVILCCEAAFTGKERLKASEFRHSHIAGNHVSGGKLYKGYPCRANTGCFAYYKDSKTWEFAYDRYSQCLDKAVKKHGMAFGQTMIIFNGKDVHGRRPVRSTTKNIYRALCEWNGKLYIVDSGKQMTYAQFIAALKRLGVTHALYLDMGIGWNFSFYRDNSDAPRYIHSIPIPFTTNWITFYK